MKPAITRATAANIGAGLPRAGLREVLLLSYPIIISMASHTLMGLTDTFFMGWLGPVEQAAAGMGSALAFSLLSFFFGVISGLTTFVAQSIGAKRNKFCGHIFWHSLYFILPCVPIVIFGIIPFVGLLLETMHANAEVLPHSLAYLKVRLYPALILFVGFAGVSFLRGAGDMKSPAIITVIALVINVPCTYVLSFGLGPIPALGVLGAAYGTVIAQVVETSLYLIVIFGKKNHLRFATRKIARFDVETFKRFLFISLPIGVAWILEHVGWMVFTIFVLTQSKEALAAHTIVYQILNLCFMPGLAISIATATLVGQYLGANDPLNAQRSANISIGLSIAVMSSLGFIILIFQTPIASAFSNDPQVISIAGTLFIFGAIYQVFDALNLAASGALRGAGDTRFPMFISIIAIWCVLVPGVFIFGHTLGYGVYGAWFSSTSVIVILGLLYFARFRQGKWKDLRVLPINASDMLDTQTEGG